MMKRNIVISSKDDWSLTAWAYPQKVGVVELLTSLFEKSRNRFIVTLYKASISLKMRKIGLWAIQPLFNRFLAKCLCLNKGDDIVLLCYDQSCIARNLHFFKYLKTHYLNVKTAYIFTNTVEHSHANYLRRIKKLSSYFSEIFAFDKKDSAKYGFSYSYLVFNPVSSPSKAKSNCRFDAFLVAKAKNRMKEIVDVYENLVNEGLNAEFYVNCMSKSDKVICQNTDIKKNVVLKYCDVLELLKESKCVVDIMQKNSSGITLNIVEAIFYNKKIITNNSSIKEEPFFDENNIFVIGDRCDSLKKFINTPIRNYSKAQKDLFGADRLLDTIRNKE